VNYWSIPPPHRRHSPLFVLSPHIITTLCSPRNAQTPDASVFYTPSPPATPPELNKCQTVQEIDLPKEIAPQSRRIIDEGCVELSHKYSPMVSAVVIALFPNQTSNHTTRIYDARTHSLHSRLLH
jgi:hypothetical protein